MFSLTYERRIKEGTTNLWFSGDEKSNDFSDLKEKEKLRKVRKTNLGLVDYSFFPPHSKILFLGPSFGDLMVSLKKC